MHCDRAGIMWFGTYNGGVSGYDGIAWTSLDTRDGLRCNRVFSIAQGPDGFLWFGTESGGITRYRRSTTAPKARILSVQTDQLYALDTLGVKYLEKFAPITTGKRITIGFSAIDFRTILDKRQYRYRIREINDNWLHPTKDAFFDYIFQKSGTYTFEVQAIDRDLNYSEPASITLTVVSPWYKNAWIAFPSGGAVFILLISFVVLALQYLAKRREAQQLQRRMLEQERISREELEAKNAQLEEANTQIKIQNEFMEKEIQDAHDVQMSLMPEIAPHIEGLEIAGKCIPSHTVSGDFFDYLEGKTNDEIALVIADTTGKAMKGAMNAVMADGILRAKAEEMEMLSPGHLMVKMNGILKARTERLMNVTMAIAVINTSTKTLTLANAGHHALSVILREGKIKQLIMPGAFPLGIVENIQYGEKKFQLQSGDAIVLMTDGIIEAQDSAGNYYWDLGQLEETILQFTQEMSSEAMVDAILNNAMSFGGDETTGDDDMTIVVAKVL